VGHQRSQPQTALFRSVPVLTRADRHCLQGLSHPPAPLPLPGALQSDLHGLERWARANLRRFNMAKRKVLPLGRGDPKHEPRPGGERTGSGQSTGMLL